MMFRYFIFIFVILMSPCEFLIAKTYVDKDGYAVAGYEQTSLAKREVSKISLGVEASILLTYVANLTLGYNVSPTLTLEIYRETPTLTLFVGPETERGYISGVKFRYFTGNSFNLSFSPYYRLIDYAGKAPRHHFGLSGAIGNRWQWDHAYFGVDWIGAAVDRRVVSGSLTKKESGFPIFLKMAFGFLF